MPNVARFGVVPPEPARVAALDVLAPAMQRAVARVLDDVEAATGARPRVFETVRTDERQRFLYGFGRAYDDGRGRVTGVATARGGWHFYGLAVDCIHPTRAWDAPRAWWLALGGAYARHGLRWGADWNANGRTDDETFLDFPHGQWGRCKVSPSALSRTLHAAGGNPAVWRAVRAL